MTGADPASEFASCDIRDILLLAPAGCGKTEALAQRARTLAATGLVESPRKQLALTFSNRAKANLATRFRTRLGVGWAGHVTLCNFHGLAARVLRAHGELIGIGRAVGFPERGWRTRTMNECGVTWRTSSLVDAALRAAKQDLADDDEVLARLRATNVDGALQFELRLREANRLDYGDLIRHARRLLALEPVAELYRNHFSAVLVDEVQDLSLDQLDLVTRIGAGKTAYAGDTAQGIYGFAGAQPDEVFAAIDAMGPCVFELSRSYRSSPAVINAVNRLAVHMEMTQLECAVPDEWPDGGTVALVHRKDVDAEATALLEITAPLVADRAVSVGVIVRRGSRAEAFKSAASAQSIDFDDWTSPTHVGRVVDLLRSNVSTAASASVEPSEQLERLEELCRAALDSSDVDGLDEVAGACEALGELIAQGRSLRQAVGACRRAPPLDRPVAPGVHVLNGHIGKGQEFDWVVVMGLEDGHFPDFRAETEEDKREELRVLHVCASRARRGLILTVVDQVPTRYGSKLAEPCPWLEALVPAVTHRW
jgi:DNA helicase-2/ATP-dependent DNA helicase PcrA